MYRSKTAGGNRVTSRPRRRPGTACRGRTRPADDSLSVMIRRRRDERQRPRSVEGFGRSGPGDSGAGTGGRRPTRRAMASDQRLEQHSHLASHLPHPHHPGWRDGVFIVQTVRGSPAPPLPNTARHRIDGSVGEDETSRVDGGAPCSDGQPRVSSSCTRARRRSASTSSGRLNASSARRSPCRGMSSPRRTVPTVPRSPGRVRPGPGAKLVAALKAWPMLRFEVTEEASHGNDGERMSYVPGHGVFRAPDQRQRRLWS